MFNQGSKCYSNFQILLSDVPRDQASDASHWQLIEDSFLILLIAYGVALVVGLKSIKVKNTNKS
jgi:hypothetical protein